MPKKIKLPYKLLTYDIETKLKEFLGFSLGEQVIRHNQLTARAAVQHNIICIAAKWYDSKEVMLFTGPTAVEDFDKEARKADVCMGKNSARFDVKYINTERMLRGLKPYPEWMDSAEDLERQLRKYFYFPSQSLDYISKVFGFGGKVKMEFDDWVAIHNYEELLEFGSVAMKRASLILFKDSHVNVIKKGKAALKKMYFYNKKDVVDTEAALVKVLPYIKLRHNAAAKAEGHGCTVCGSLNLVATKVIFNGQTRYQQFDCLEHNGYAGKATFKYCNVGHRTKFGRMK